MIDPPSLPQLDLLLSLVAAHLLGDFVLQTRAMVAEKRKFSVLLLHAAVVALLSYVLVAQWGRWGVPVVILLTHAAIDFVKARWGGGQAKAFIIDQLAHLVVILLVVRGSQDDAHSWWFQTYGVRWLAVLAFLSGLILVVRVGGFLVGYWVQPYLDEIQRAAVANQSPVNPSRGLTTGGRVIGQWERALIFLFVGLGQPASIGFLIAAKSIFRFGELKDRENRMEAEYITIGTLMSFGWALAASYPIWELVRLWWK